MVLDHVEAFVAIVRRGGFTRASASLHLSQPAISRRVHLLEGELGAPLFERITELPEYYPTRREVGILNDHAKDIAALIRDREISPQSGIGRIYTGPSCLPA